MKNAKLSYAAKFAAILVSGFVCSADAADFVPAGKTGRDIQKAIDEATAAGGGRVVLEKGVYNSATLYLKSNVELHLPAGSVILGADRYEEYDDIDDVRIGVSPERSKKVFISAMDAENVSITGKGVIDGQGVRFYDTTSMQWERFFKKPPHPRPRMIQFFNCRNVRFEDVTFKDSPGWTCWMRFCENFTAERVRIHGDQRMINNDGFHIDSCKHVRIRNCELETGDDCIIMRAIRKADGKMTVCEDMIVENCSLNSACQCIRLSCPSDGTIRDGIFRGLKMRGFNGVLSGHPVRYLMKGDAGCCRMENILVENCDIDVAGSAISFFVEPGIRLNNFGDVTFRDIRLKSKGPLRFKGSGDTLLRNIKLENVSGTVDAVSAIETASIAGFLFDNVTLTSGAGNKSPLPQVKSDSWETERN